VQNQLPGAQVPLPAGADCASAAPGTASTEVKATEARNDLVMMRQALLCQRQVNHPT